MLPSGLKDLLLAHIRTRWRTLWGNICSWGPLGNLKEIPGLNSGNLLLEWLVPPSAVRCWLGKRRASGEAWLGWRGRRVVMGLWVEDASRVLSPTCHSHCLKLSSKVSSRLYPGFPPSGVWVLGARISGSRFSFKRLETGVRRVERHFIVYK